MKKYTDMSLQERQAEYAAVQAEYEKLKAMDLSLNMARGKPGKAQLDLVTPIFSLLTKPEDFVSDGIETRNYGEVSGIPAAKALFADILGCKPEQVFVGGNASLQNVAARQGGRWHERSPRCRRKIGRANYREAARGRNPLKPAPPRWCTGRSPPPPPR